MPIKIYGSITDIEQIKEFKEYPKIKLESNTGDFIYIKGRIMTVDTPNSNGDFFSRSEVIKEREYDGKKLPAYLSFIGGIVDYNHDSNILLGRIIDATYVELKNPKENEHDYVQIICKLNRNATKNAPVDYIAQIESGILNQLSLEAYADRAQCSVCNHIFNFMEISPCSCITGGLMRKIKGEDGNEHLVFKKDLDLTFTGAGVVPNPADKTADINTIIAKDNNKTIKSFNSNNMEGMEGTLNAIKESIIERLKDEYKWKQEYIDKFEDEIESWVLTDASDNLENLDLSEMTQNINKDLSRKIEEYEEDKKEDEEADKVFEKENGEKGIVESKDNNKVGLNDALKKLNAFEFLNILKAIENKNSGKTQSIAMEIMGKAEILTEKEFYDILSKDYGKLTTIEIEDIKNILRSNKRLLSNEYGAYTFTDNDETYWVVERYGVPVPGFRKKVSDIWGEDYKKDSKVDSIPLKEYAISSDFKKRLLYTIASKGIEYLRSTWEIEDETKLHVDDNLLTKIMGRVKEIGIKLTAEEVVIALWNGSGSIASSETHYVKDKFCKCVEENMNNENIVLKGKQSKTEAAEAFCYNKILSSRITAGLKETNIDKIIWNILGSNYEKCISKNDIKVCAWLERNAIGFDKMIMSHRVFASQFNIKSMKSIGWDVYLNGKVIDTVWFGEDSDAEYVKNSLIDHDNCDPNIMVEKE